MNGQNKLSISQRMAAAKLEIDSVRGGKKPGGKARRDRSGKRTAEARVKTVEQHGSTK